MSKNIRDLVTPQTGWLYTDVREQPGDCTKERNRPIIRPAPATLADIARELV